MLPPKAPGESPALPLPASGGCGCKTLTSASVITWSSLLSVSIFCLCQSSFCLSVRTLVVYHLGSTFSLLQSTWWLAQISSQRGLELQCGFNWTKHQRCPKDVSLGAILPEMPPDTWESFEKGKVTGWWSSHADTADGTNACVLLERSFSLSQTISISQVNSATLPWLKTSISLCYSLTLISPVTLSQKDGEENLHVFQWKGLQTIDNEGSTLIPVALELTAGRPWSLSQFLWASVFP